MLALALSLAAVAPCPAGERYYMLLFAADTQPPRARYTHTWATFVRAAGPAVRDVRTVSWLPATLDIRPLRLRREPGANLSLADTLAWAAGFGGRVALWGPVEIDAEHYAAFAARADELDAGGVTYRALGSFRRRDASVSNCGQSFSRAAPEVGRRFLQPTPFPGQSGTSLLAVRLDRAGAFIDPDVRHDWLLPTVGVDPASFVRYGIDERVPFFGRLAR